MQRSVACCFRRGAKGTVAPAGTGASARKAGEERSNAEKLTHGARVSRAFCSSRAHTALGPHPETLLKTLKPTKIKDTRSPEEQDKWRQEARMWSDKVTAYKAARQRHDDSRWNFIWESIAAIPEGPLRCVRVCVCVCVLFSLTRACSEAASQPDLSEVPYVMRALVMADVGPIPDSEVERLRPYVIDHSLLQVF